MSTLEKLLVLGVLVLVGVILAISLFWTREPGTVIPASDSMTNTQRDITAPANPLAPTVSPITVAENSGAASRPVEPTVILTTAPRPPVAAVPNALVHPSGNKDLWLYSVRAGDTPQSVSSKLTGSPASAHKIWVANESKPLVPGKDIFIPNEVFANAKPATDGAVSAPPSSELAAAQPPKSIATGVGAPTASPAGPLASPKPAGATPLAKNEKKPAGTDSTDGDRVYKVKQGDTLRAIARAQLKDERRWKEIVDLNHITGEVIRAGQSIKLPPAK